MAEFTPGPWIIFQVSNDPHCDPFFSIMPAGRDGDIAALEANCGLPQSANASLIVAAPDLYEVASLARQIVLADQGVAEFPCSPSEFLAKANAALAKANGNSVEARDDRT